MDSKILFAISLLFAVSGCQHNQSPASDFSAFHPDLLYQGKPIHPSRVLATQFGDSSRLEPKSIIPPKSGEFDDEWFHTLEENLSYGPKGACYTRDYTVKSSIDRTHSMLDEYEYIGSYNGKHIILGQNYDTSGTGRFAFLNAIVRSNDTICNAGEITAGDRGSGGIISIRSFENNILRYAQCVTLDTALKEFAHISLDTFFPPMVSGISLIYEVDLDAPLVNSTDYATRVIGLSLDDDDYALEDPGFPQEENYHYQQQRIEYAFYAIANEYVTDGKRELDLTDAHAFTQKFLHEYNKSEYTILT